MNTEQGRQPLRGDAEDLTCQCSFDRVPSKINTCFTISEGIKSNGKLLLLIK